jgi:exodeoxyribonuclease VII small subunit
MADSTFDDIKAKEIAEMSFETALKELESIVGKLESGQAPLAESIAIYERGEALKAHCEALLKAAEMRIEKITLRGGQPVGTEPLDPQ